MEVIFDEMYAKFMEQFEGAQQYTKECAGISRPRIFSGL